MENIKYYKTNPNTRYEHVYRFRNNLLSVLGQDNTWYLLSGGLGQLGKACIEISEEEVVAVKTMRELIK